MAILKDNTGNTSASSKFGANGGARKRTASKFIATANWTITDVDVRVIRDTGTPTGDVQIQIYTDDSGLPSSTQVGGTATVAVADTSGSYTDFNKSFSSTVACNSGVTYWLVMKVSSGESDLNYYNSRSTITGALNNGALYETSSWANNNDDLYYRLNGTGQSEYTMTATVGTFTFTGFPLSLSKKNITNTVKPTTTIVNSNRIL